MNGRSSLRRRALSRDGLGLGGAHGARAAALWLSCVAAGLSLSGVALGQQPLPPPPPAPSAAPPPGQPTAPPPGPPGAPPVKPVAGAAEAQPVPPGQPPPQGYPPGYPPPQGYPPGYPPPQGYPPPHLYPYGYPPGYPPYYYQAPPPPPPRKPFVEGQPAPEGYRLQTGPNKRMLVAGAAMFGGAYLFSVLGAAFALGEEGPDQDKWAPLFVPVVGPWVTLGTASDQAFNGRATDGDELGILLVLDGVAQAAGLTIFIIGAASQRREWVRKDLSWLVPEARVGLGQTHLRWTF